ncbi:hypothetical protein BC830DRAFT_1107285 [Chytriomyces sp. MP71]|nr:hypothetical protein BC830DRAFT_1107285 [Chytriomyces sp. MP71]
MNSQTPPSSAGSWRSTASVTRAGGRPSVRFTNHEQEDVSKEDALDHALDLNNTRFSRMGGSSRVGRKYGTSRASLSGASSTGGDEEEDDKLDDDMSRKRAVAAAVSRRLSRGGHSDASTQSRRQSALQQASGIINASNNPSLMNLASHRTSIAPPVPSNVTSYRDTTFDPFLDVTFNKPRVPRERVRYLWNLVRSSFLRKTPQMVQLLLQTNTQQPYALSIRQGFQFKYRLKTKYQIKCLILHSKLSWQAPGATGSASTENEDDQEQKSKIMDLYSKSVSKTADGSLDSLSAGEEGGLSGRKQLTMEGRRIEASYEDPSSHRHYTKFDEDEYQFKRVNKIMKPSTFVCADASRTVRMWDVTRNTQLKPKSAIKLNMEIYEFAYMARFSMYVSCCDSKSINFFNLRFELISTFYTEHYVHHIKYNNLLNELITVGSHEVVLWTLENMLNKGATIPKPLPKYKICTHLPEKEWLTGVFYDESRHKLFAIVNSKVLVFDMQEGKEVDRWIGLSQRQITCIIYYEMYDYSILGCVDGSIKVINMTNAMVHEFTSHTRPITALAIYPYGPIVISCALDYTVRMYNLKTFKEVYCLHLKEKPTGMQIMDDLQLYISTWDTIMVWGLNHINTSFSTINTPVSHIMLAKAKNLPARVLVRSEDGVIRLVSPISGKVLTTSLPLLETDCIRAMAYCASIDRMFLLVESGEIWVVATCINPCVVVDIWTPPQIAKDEVSHLIMFDGSFESTGDVPYRSNRDSGFALLIGGTITGQVIIYGTTGEIVKRAQLHFGALTELAAAQNVLISGGEDCLIYISTLEPATTHVIQAIICIHNLVPPRRINICDSILCSVGDDFVVKMFGFNLNNHTWYAIPAHNRSDDHVDQVTSVCSIEHLGLFVTTSHDTTIRIWDMFNALLREIKFHDPLECLCVCSRRGDLLIAIQNRIDIIKYNLYLPPGYIKSSEALILPDEHTESPIQFDEKFDFLSNYLAHRRSNYRFDADIFSSGSKLLENFKKINFTGAKWKIQKDSDRRSNMKVVMSKEDEAYLPIMSKLKTIMERRQKMIELMKQHAELEFKEVQRRQNLIHEEFESFIKYKPYMGTLLPNEPVNPIEIESPVHLVESIDDFIPLDPLSLLNSRQEEALKERPIYKADDEIKLVEFTEPPIIPLLDPRSPDPVEPSVLATEDINVNDPVIRDLEVGAEPTTALEPEAQTESVGDSRIIVRPEPKQAAAPRLKVAPDGEIPNSVVKTTVKNWKAIHAWNNIVETSLFKRGRQKGDDIAVNKDKEKRSEIYKARLKKMMEDQAARELEEQRKKKEAEGTMIVVAEEEAEGEKAANDDDDEDIEALRKMKPQFKVLKAPELAKYPRLIDKAIQYSWFPIDDILHPKDSTEAEGVLRRIKVDVNSEALFPIAMECFRTLKGIKERKEAADYAGWIVEEFGIRDTVSMVRTFMRYMQNSVYFKLTSDHEIELLVRIMDLCVNFGQTQVDLIVTLLMMMAHENEMIREAAKTSLETLHADKILTPHVIKKVTEFYAKALPLHLADQKLKSRHGISTPRSTSAGMRAGSAGFRAGSAGPRAGSGKQNGVPNSTGPVPTAVPQSPAATEYRNLVMGFLRKILKNYLMMATTDLEALNKLKELNDSGFEAKKREDDDDYVEPVKVINRGRRRGMQIFEPEVESAPVKKRTGQLVYTSTPAINELMAISEVEPLTRGAVLTLQNPNLKDFITALLQYAKYNERRHEKEIADKNHRAEMEALVLEEARLKKEKEEKLKEYLKRKEQMKNQRNQERRMRLLELREKTMQPVDDEFPKIKRKGGLRENLFTGHTHTSKCHPSREGLNQTLREGLRLPFL